MGDPPVFETPGRLAQIACILEATARKPGNIHRFADFEDCSYLDFLLSASAIVGPLDRARIDGVGFAVLNAIVATRRVTRTNTNLGMVLLLAPLAAIPDGVEPCAGIKAVLDRLTMDDARLAYRAIRLSHPGGLGSSEAQDVREEPTVSLVEAMRLAAGRDRVARQYAEGYADVFDVALPALRTALEREAGLEAAIIECFLRVLAAIPDSLIARKVGPELAKEASRRAEEALRAGVVEPGSEPLQGFDAWLRADGHARNPGTTADLVTAALFLALRESTIKLPMKRF